MVTVSNRQSADLMDCILIFSRRVVIDNRAGKFVDRKLPAISAGTLPTNAR